MSTLIEKNAPIKLSDIDLKPRGQVYSSPSSWRDQVLYFLLPDRFSDGRDQDRPLFDRSDMQQFKADKWKWMEAGKAFQGGTLKGIESKLDYLRTLGATALWIGPIWHQRIDLDTYHGYGIQNFLDVDPRFGTRQDLRDLIDATHEKDMYVLIDVIYNHSGNNWFYRNFNGNACDAIPYRYKPTYPFNGWRSKGGQRVDHIIEVGDAVWPEEFQNPEWYTRAGQIQRWDPEPWEHPLHPDCEFRRGDFFDLKDLDHSNDEVLDALIRVYRYWIALSDCDGFRIDTVKHTSFEASRNFCGAIREYAESIGKENFLLLGEVTGGSKMIRDYLEIFGRNIDAALDIGAPAERLADMVKGYGDPQMFFNQFGGQDEFGSHRMIGRYHVSILDDHDMVGRQSGKRRFLAGNNIDNKYEQAAHAVGVQLTTLGIPCIYYGTEQAFDGSEDHHDIDIEPSSNGIDYSDRYVRECMFGGTFGAFQTEGCHFFDNEHPTYVRIAAITRIRNRQDIIGLTLRRGRQYLRKTSISDTHPFITPQSGELVAWSRVLYDQDILIILNTNGAQNESASILLDSRFHPEGSNMRFLYKGDWSDAELKTPPVSESIPLKHVNGTASIDIDLPPAGMAILV
ncbi:MAG: alpha-amylase family glycosyl hydrolase [Candidatus Bathyarchaeota archaeon]|nr:alpha-amylase family glycosyl hydrolase [Candidatus Bathyarchaeota archaeon]